MQYLQVLLTPASADALRLVRGFLDLVAIQTVEEALKRRQRLSTSALDVALRRTAVKFLVTLVTSAVLARAPSFTASPTNRAMLSAFLFSANAKMAVDFLHDHASESSPPE
jgi:hypothetical protein